MKTIFMIDLETTGVDIFSADVLQICLLPLQLEGSGLFMPFDGHLELAGWTDKKAQSEFEVKHLAQHFATANAGRATRTCESWAAHVRFQLLKRIGTAGKHVQFVGHRATQFDLPILHRLGCLIAPGYRLADGKDVAVGDHDYRTIEIAGALDLICLAHGLRHDAAKQAAMALCPEIELPEGRGEHDAVYDCYAQAKLLNGLLRMARM